MRRPRFTRARRFSTALVLLLTMALVAAGCGQSGGGSAGGEGSEGGEAAEAPDANGVVRMVLAPDPVWDWLTDQGIREEMEQEAGIQILDSSTWDEFGVYAGGHADVVSAAAYEVPDLEESTGIPTTVFGRYNADRSILAVRAEDAEQYQDICALEGQPIVSLSAVSVTIMWGIYARETCDLDLSAEGGDYDLVVTDIQNMAGLVADGDAEACLCMPDFAIPQLREGELVPLYDGRSAAQIFADDYGEGHRGPQTNVFLAPEAWVDNNPEEAAFLLAVWERGLQEWRDHRDEIIEAYPQHFAAESPEDIAFIQDWLDTNFDWFEETVYLDEEWVEGETQIFELMQETGYLEEGIDPPDFTIIEPPSR
jgi:ABC-type nitrate/sulfonate/bicarbonate transport system substrate-binding protein